MAADVGSTIDGLLSCLCDALAAVQRAVCACGPTVGPPVLGPSVCDCDCDDNDGTGGQLSATLTRMYPVDPVSFAQIATVANCRASSVAADVAFTLARCHPTIDAQGNPPTLDDVAAYADGALDDAQTMWNALLCGCQNYKLVVRDVAIDSNPEGGCSAVGLRLSVLVKPTTPTVAS